MWRACDFFNLKVPGPNNEMMWMDDIHVQAIHQFCSRVLMDTVLEIGLWAGFTTSAILDAGDHDHGYLSVLCDVAIRESVRDLARHKNAVIYQGKSVDLLKMIQTPDLVIVDGDHSREAVFDEESHMNRLGVQSFFAHDCGSASQPGPAWLYDKVIRDKSWCVFMDDRERPGMATQRGLMFATKRIDHAGIAATIFDELRKLES